MEKAKKLRYHTSIAPLLFAVVITLLPSSVEGLTRYAKNSNDTILELRTEILNQKQNILPRPMPNNPEGFGSFDIISSNTQLKSNKVIISNWTKTGGPGSKILLAGSAMNTSDLRFKITGKYINGGTVSQTVLPDNTTSNTAVITIPENFAKDSIYVVWPMINGAEGPAISINQSTIQWVDTNHAYNGGTIGIFGENLINEATGASHVLLTTTREDSYTWLEVTSSNQYHLEAKIPDTLKPGRYIVWTHNGYGGDLGWSQSKEISISKEAFWASHSQNIINVKDHGAKGNGKSDDTNAINQAVEAAKKIAPSTLYFPKGTYIFTSGFEAPSNVTWKGAGMANTILKAGEQIQNEQNFYKQRFWNIGGNHEEINIAIENITIDMNRAYNPTWNLYDAFAIRIQSSLHRKNLRLSNTTINAAPAGCLNSQIDGLLLENFTCIGGNNFLRTSKNVTITNSTFLSTDDANSILTFWGGENISINNSQFKDYNQNTENGQGRGRVLVTQGTWGSVNNIYFGKNQITDFAPRKCPVDDYYCVDQNSGEQVLFENNNILNEGIIKQAQSNKLQIEKMLSTKHWHENASVVILSGNGAGQTAQIKSINDNGEIELKEELRVIPSKGDKIIVANITDHAVIYDNYFDGDSDYNTRKTASAGVELYGNGHNIIIDSNKFNELRSALYIVANHKKQKIEDTYTLRPNYFVTVKNNSITNTHNATILAIDKSDNYQEYKDAVKLIGILFDKNTGSNTINHGEYIKDEHQSISNFADNDSTYANNQIVIDNRTVNEQPQPNNPPKFDASNYYNITRDNAFTKQLFSISDENIESLTLTAVTDSGDTLEDIDAKIVYNQSKKAYEFKWMAKQEFGKIGPRGSRIEFTVTATDIHGAKSSVPFVLIIKIDEVLPIPPITNTPPKFNDNDHYRKINNGKYLSEIFKIRDNENDDVIVTIENEKGELATNINAVILYDKNKKTHTFYWKADKTQGTDDSRGSRVGLRVVATDSKGASSRVKFVIIVK